MTVPRLVMAAATIAAARSGRRYTALEKQMGANGIDKPVSKDTARDRVKRRHSRLMRLGFRYLGIDNTSEPGSSRRGYFHEKKGFVEQEHFPVGNNQHRTALTHVPHSRIKTMDANGWGEQAHHHAKKWWDTMNDSEKTEYLERHPNFKPVPNP